MRVEATEHFRCPIERLWSYITEPEKQKLWMKGLLQNEPTSGDHGAAGSTFRMVIQEGRKPASYDGVVTVCEEPNRLEVLLKGGNFPTGAAMRVDYRLSESDGITRLDYSCALESQKRPGFFMRLLFVVAKLFGKRQLRSFLRKLKQLVEAPAQAA